MKLSMGEIPFLVSPKGLFLFAPAGQHPKPHQWLSGNDASYWESSLFPGATIFSKMAFILNWLDTIYFACLIWHHYNPKQSVKEQRGAAAPAAGAAARVCSPEVAAKEGATTPGQKGFPIAVTAHWLQNGLHMWLCNLWFWVFLSQLEEVQLFLSVMLQIGTPIVATLGSKDNHGLITALGGRAFLQVWHRKQQKPFFFFS